MNKTIYCKKSARYLTAVPEKNADKSRSSASARENKRASVRCLLAWMAILILAVSMTLSSCGSNSGSSSTPVKDKVVEVTVNPSLKKVLDDYEKFIDNYIAFVKKYQNSSNPMAMLNDYLKMMNDYTKWINDINSLDTSKMTDADYAYYTAVLLRVEQKLLKELQ